MAQTIQTLQNQLLYARKQKSYAWAKYYEQVNQAHHDDIGMYQTIVRTSDEMPVHFKDEFKQMALELKKKWECPVCIEFIPDEALEITNCGHFYCKTCLETWKTNEKAQGKNKWKCYMCNRQHNFTEE